MKLIQIAIIDKTIDTIANILIEDDVLAIP